MNMRMCGFAMSLGIMATGVHADQLINVDGEEYSLSTLTENCQSITDDPAAQISCFSALSKLLEEQSEPGQDNSEAITQALDALRAVAQYQDEESGLLIAGADCNIHILYFNNYFHISRRNVSTIDLISAQFDASKLQYDQTVQGQGGQVPLSKGFMDSGATAAMRGGAAIDSSLDNFEPRSPRTTIDVYANEVVAQLPAREGAEFDFVLVHPQRSQASAEIWGAFDAFAEACHG